MNRNLLTAAATPEPSILRETRRLALTLWELVQSAPIMIPVVYIIPALCLGGGFLGVGLIVWNTLVSAYSLESLEGFATRLLLLGFLSLPIYWIFATLYAIAVRIAILLDVGAGALPKQLFDRRIDFESGASSRISDLPLQPSVVHSFSFK